MRRMGLNIGGYEDRPDWPKMGPSLLIATCLILAIRTAKWPSRSSDSTASNVDLEKEIEHAAYLAGRVFARLVAETSQHLSERETALVPTERRRAAEMTPCRKRYNRQQMCGRYRLSRRAEILASYFYAEYEGMDWEARYNIAPTQTVPVIRQDPQRARSSCFI